MTPYETVSSAVSAQITYKQLLSQKKLTFKTALEIVLSIKATVKNSFTITTPTPLPIPSATEEVHQVADRQSTTLKLGKKLYNRCGSPAHLVPACCHLKTVHKSHWKKEI